MFENVDLTVERETEFVEGWWIRRHDFVRLYALENHVFHVLATGVRERLLRLHGGLVEFDCVGLRDPSGKIAELFVDEVMEFFLEFIVSNDFFR